MEVFTIQYLNIEMLIKLIMRMYESGEYTFATGSPERVTNHKSFGLQLDFLSA